MAGKASATVLFIVLAVMAAAPIFGVHAGHRFPAFILLKPDVVEMSVARDVSKPPDSCLPKGSVCPFEYDYLCCGKCVCATKEPPLGTCTGDC